MTRPLLILLAAILMNITCSSGSIDDIIRDQPVMSSAVDDAPSTMTSSQIKGTY